MAEAGAGRCVFCGCAIVPDRDYQKVEGFVKRRAAGGANAVALREPKDKWACAQCIGLQSNGLSSGQQGLSF